MSTRASSSRDVPNRSSADGRGGALAALLVLFLDLLWRVTLVPTGAQSIPENSKPCACLRAGCCARHVECYARTCVSMAASAYRCAGCGQALFVRVPCSTV